MITLPTPAEFDTFTIAQLTTLYNALSGKPPIKKFETRGKGILKTGPLWAAARQAQEAAVPATPAKPKAVKSQGLSAQICKLILEGLTNEAIVTRLGLDAKRKSYPSWNRAMMKRTGKL